MRQYQHDCSGRSLRRHFALFQNSRQYATVEEEHAAAPKRQRRDGDTVRDVGLEGRAVIMRIFRARVKPGRWADFDRLCREKSIPLMRSQPGLITLQVGRAMERQPNEFVLVSVWKDLASLKGFAGERWREAVILPGEAELVEEAGVQHFVQDENDVLQSFGEPWRVTSAALSEREERAAHTLRITDAQWERIHPLLPAPSHEGRPRADDRRTLEGVLYVLRTGCRWQDLPPEFGSPVTCWRRYSRWQADGTWDHIWRMLLSSLDTSAKLVWARALLDGSFIPAKRGRRLG